MVDKREPSGLISRSVWGAKYDDGFRDRPVPISEFWLHHSVTIAPDLIPPFTDDDAAIRTLERIGEERFGGGISYTVPVTPVGRAYSGHSWWRQGAHTKGHNTVGVAFVLVGNYNNMKPTAEQIKQIARVMVEAHRIGIATRHTLNGGHRQASGNIGVTECPGSKGLAAIPEINALAERLWNGEEEEDDMQLTDRVEVDNAQGVNESVTIATMFNRMNWVYNETIRQREQLKALVANEGAQTAALKAIAANPDISIEALTEASKAGAKAALDEKISDAEVNLTVEP